VKELEENGDRRDLKVWRLSARIGAKDDDDSRRTRDGRTNNIKYHNRLCCVRRFWGYTHTHTHTYTMCYTHTHTRVLYTKNTPDNSLSPIGIPQKSSTALDNKHRTKQRTSQEMVLSMALSLVLVVLLGVASMLGCVGAALESSEIAVDGIVGGLVGAERVGHGDNIHDNIHVRTVHKDDFGGEVIGIDVEHLSDAEFDIIHNALLKYKVLAVRNQSSLSVEGQRRFTQRFGELQVHLESASHHPGYQDVNVVSNIKGDNGVPIGLYGKHVESFHSDLSW
jgi:hypothetical protein